VRQRRLHPSSLPMSTSKRISIGDDRQSCANTSYTPAQDRSVFVSEVLSSDKQIFEVCSLSRPSLL
jgi:hypothetical protein